MRSTIAGQTIYILLLVSLFTLYLALFRKDYFTKPRSIAMLYALLVFFPLLTSFMMKHPFFSIYIIPFAISPIFGRVFMDSRTAFIQHVTTILICAVAVKYQYEFITVQLVAGLVAIYSLRELSRRSQIFLTAIRLPRRWSISRSSSSRRMMSRSSTAPSTTTSRSMVSSSSSPIP